MYEDVNEALEDGAGENSAAVQYAKDTPGQNVEEWKKVSVTVDWEHGNPNDYSADWEAEGVFVLDYDSRKKEMEIGGEEKALAAWIEMTYGLSKNAARSLMRSAKRVKWKRLKSLEK